MRAKLLFIGDLVGDPGRALFQKNVGTLREKHKIDFVVVNGENSAADGRGITPTIMASFKEMGVDLVTSGNHIWAKKEIIPYFNDHKDLLRPANFPAGCPGSGVAILTSQSGFTLGVLNLQGRVFMRELVNCPFRAADSALTFLKSRTDCILVDMHAEASSEKMGMGYYLDGQVSAVVGTHTHVQTADERILPGGTAFISDVGCGAALNSMIGMKTEIIIKNMLTQMPVKFAVETEGPFQLCGVIITIEDTGKALAIERLQIVDHDLRMS
jgi:metallophosphoesterase (TIGR00282 family)